jgi:alcohol dehydrogenase (cytochrome c)
MRQIAAALAAMVAGLAPGALPAQDTDIWKGVFTEEQASRGQELYAANCGACHGSALTSDDPDVPTLTAPAFRWSWQTRTLAERFDKIRTTMPPGAAGSLTDQEYLDIIAHILHFNGYPAGTTELVPDPDRLAAIVLSVEP